MKTWMIPAMENHKQFVQSIYPNAEFCDGAIYATGNDDVQEILNKTKWDNSGIEAEYYAWMWSRQHIEEELMRKLES